jgi:hypothetical protein
MTEHEAKNVRPTPFAVAVYEERALAEIHLDFLAGPALHAPKRHWRLRAQPSHEAPHAVIRMRETVLTYQILPDPPRAQPLVQLGQDLCVEGRALARRAWCRWRCTRCAIVQIRWRIRRRRIVERPLRSGWF